MAFSFTSQVKPRQRRAGEGQEQEGKAEGRRGGHQQQLSPRQGQGRGGAGVWGGFEGPGPRGKMPLELAWSLPSLKSARWRFPEPAWRNLLRCRAYRGCYSPHGCGEAGERLGSLCAIEVEGRKRRPPTEVGGLGLEFRSLGFMV